MKSKLTFVIYLFFYISTYPLYAQKPEMYAQSITQDDVAKIIRILASDSLEGRETGSLGQKKAAAFILNHYKTNGLTPVVKTDTGKSFFQTIEMGEKKIVEGYVDVGGQRYAHLKQAFFIQANQSENSLETELLFVGRGQDKDYMDLEVKGKMVLIFGSNFSVMRRTELARQRGALGCIIVANKNESAFKSFMARMTMVNKSLRPSLRTDKDNFTLIAVSPESASRIFNTRLKRLKSLMDNNHESIENLNKKISPIKLQLWVKHSQAEIITENVLGYIEGTHFPEEVIIITAHYDHLGVKGEHIFNGADDNASGTTALMEISEAFSLAAKEGYRPKRSVLFMALTAEEKGLLGSEYYTDYSPVFPLANTVLNLNMDMIGHLDNVHDHPNFVCIVGSDWLSSELHEIHERVNQTYVGLVLDYTYNSKDHPERFYYRSDQYNFAKYNIPVIFYTSGDHDDYHKPTDTVENIKFERIQKVAQLIFHTAWEVANREKRLLVDKKID